MPLNQLIATYFDTGAIFAIMGRNISVSHIHPLPLPRMSENLSEDAVVQALNLERKIDQDLAEGATDKARKNVRDDMEKWLELMNEPKVRSRYAEELGDLDPKVAEVEMLRAINESFPRVAKELGYKPEMAVIQEQDMQHYQDADTKRLAA